jgi:GAF domain-containing protein
VLWRKQKSFDPPVSVSLLRMSSELHIDRGLSKADTYRALQPQIASLVAGESNLIANLANVSAALKEAFHFWWVGFYLVDGEQLVLGPFQGPVACTRLSKNKGVCAHSWQTAATVIVPDVDAFPGHIACSSATRSEIVVPLKHPDGTVWAVLDVDSEHLDFFDDIDAKELEAIVNLIHP